MTQNEKEMISTLPDKFKPIGAWTYFTYSIIFSIPVIGFIVLLITALGSSNVNLRSYARSFFCAFILVMIVVGVLLATGIGAAIIGAVSGTIA